MGAGGGSQAGVEGLVEAQKQIIVATWNLDARARRAQRRAVDSRTSRRFPRPQADLRDRARRPVRKSSRINDPRVRRRAGAGARRRSDWQSSGGDGTRRDRARQGQHQPRAAARDGGAQRAAPRRSRKPSPAGHALAAGGRRRWRRIAPRRISRACSTRSCGNASRPITKRRIRPRSVQETKSENPLDRIRELARRQDALNRSQRDLMRNRDQMDAEELKRQLERLTREQNELRQQAQQLAQQAQNGQDSQNGQNGQSGQSGQKARVTRTLRTVLAHRSRTRTASGYERSPRTCATRLTGCSVRIRARRRRAAIALPNGCAISSAACRRRVPTSVAARSATCRWSRVRSPTRNGGLPTRRTAPPKATLALTLAAGWPPSRSASPNAPIACRTTSASCLAAAKAMPMSSRPCPMPSASWRSRTSDSVCARPPRDFARAARANNRRQEIARSMDRVAERLGAASGTRDADSRRHSDQLARSQELRDRLQEIDRNLEAMKREPQGGEQGQPSQSQSTGPGAEPAPGRPGPGSRPARPVATVAGSPAARTGSPEWRQRRHGERLEQLQRDVNEQMREAERLADDMRRDNPGHAGQSGKHLVAQLLGAGHRGVQAGLRTLGDAQKHMLVALEDVETKISDDLRARESQQRLNAGGHETVNEAYRELVDKYLPLAGRPAPPAVTSIRGALCRRAPVVGLRPRVCRGADLCLVRLRAPCGPARRQLGPRAAHRASCPHAPAHRRRPAPAGALRCGRGASDNIVAILVDGSRSMRLTDEGGPRIERARAIVQQLQSSLGHDFKTDLLAFGESVAPHRSWTTRCRRATQRLERRARRWSRTAIAAVRSPRGRRVRWRRYRVGRSRSRRAWRSRVHRRGRQRGVAARSRSDQFHGRRAASQRVVGRSQRVGHQHRVWH